VQPQQEPSPPHSQNGDDDDDDDVIIVDPPQQPSGKRKVGDDQPSPRPPKRQPFWVEVPPRSKRKRVSSAPVKTEESTPEVAIQVTLTAPAVKEEPDQEVANALAAVRNVCLNLNLPQNTARQFSSRPSSPADELEERKEILRQCLRFYEAV